jgi:hypothetical protein
MERHGITLSSVIIDKKAIFPKWIVQFFRGGATRQFPPFGRHAHQAGIITPMEVLNNLLVYAYAVDDIWFQVVPGPGDRGALQPELECGGGAEWLGEEQLFRGHPVCPE